MADIMDLDYQEKYPKDNDYRQRFTVESSRFYTHKMLELVNGDETRMGEMKGAVPGLLLPNHLMYRIETLQSQDGHRLYEFLIEYDMKSPSEGIYYGCRGITIAGYNHETEIEQFRRDWDTLKPEVCRVLNNTFPDKDYSMRFRLTDNANTNTYWLFWISLYEDEDIHQVGVVATEKIRDVFKQYLMGVQFPEKNIPTRNTPVKTAFFNKNYETLLTKVIDVPTFEAFLSFAEAQGWIERNSLYERAWVFHGDGAHNKNVDFINMMRNLGEQQVFNKKRTVPWASLAEVFLDNNELAFGNLREQQSTMKNDIFWYDAMKPFWKKYR